MICSPKNSAFTLLELLVSLLVGSVAIGFILMSYLSLQRGYAFAISWSETRVAQARVMDSMAQDLRNATAVAGTVSGTSCLLPLTLTIPARFDNYESQGAWAGDPQLSGTINAPVVSSTTGKILYGTITVTYERAGNLINRRVSRAGISPDATRTIGVFGGGVLVQFKNQNNTAFVSTDNPIIPVVSATTSSWNSDQTVTTTMTDRIFLRGTVYR